MYVCICIKNTTRTVGPEKKNSLVVENINTLKKFEHQQKPLMLQIRLQEEILDLKRAFYGKKPKTFQLIGPSYMTIYPHNMGHASKTTAGLSREAYNISSSTYCVPATTGSQKRSPKHKVSGVEI